MSLDGVQESKSSTNNLDIYSIKFNHCRNIYPLRIIKPCERYKYDEQEQLKEVLSSLNAKNVIIDCAVLDKIKRSTVNCAKGHSSKFPCEYCESPAVPYVHCNKKIFNTIKKKYETKEKKLKRKIRQLEEAEENPNENEEILNLRESLETLTQDKENELKKKGRKQLKWPSSTMNGTPRTIDGITAIVEEIETNPEIVVTNPDFCKGIKGRSLLLNQPFFNLIVDVPCEYMHLLCLGVVKRMVELNFKVGEHRERNTKRKLTPPSVFNEKIKCIQVTREFPRRCRNLDFSVYKACEFKNLLIFFFPIVIDCIEDNHKNDKRVWLHLVYMIRACVLPNEEFRKINTDVVENACKKFYVLYEKLYGTINCTYSVHTLPSHLLKIRGNRPLTHKSAFKFESFFAEMKNLFQPGTVSSVMQILKNSYMKRILEFHSCQKTLFFSPEKNPDNPGKLGKENNSLIYCYNEDDTISMYIIVREIDEESFSCRIQGKFKVKFDLTPEYDWSDVGVFKIGPISEECQVVMKNTISGKFLKVNNYLITCPTNVLLEQ